MVIVNDHWLMILYQRWLWIKTFRDPEVRDPNPKFRTEGFGIEPRSSRSFCSKKKISNQSLKILKISKKIRFSFFAKSDIFFDIFEISRFWIFLAHTNSNPWDFYIRIYVRFLCSEFPRTSWKNHLWFYIK